MRRWQTVALGFVLITASAAFAQGSSQATSSAATPAIGFETPSVVDPIHTFGEPDVGIDPQGRVFSSGPTGTGTQRSVWFGSVDGGHTFRVVTPCPLAPFPPCAAPDALTGTTAPPGGGDTDINFDRSGKQYFADLAALICLRTATTADGGKNVYQSVYPAGCDIPGADRQWLAVYDPAPSLTTTSAYTGPKPLIYLAYNNLTSGTQWNKSNAAVDLAQGGPGLNYFPATKGTTSVCVENVSTYAPFGADGYPQIDQVTGKVFQAAGFHNTDGTYSLLLNIGTPDASGDLTFLDYPTPGNPCGDKSKLIHIADNLKWPPDTLFSVLSMDSARNLFVVFNLGDSASNVPPSDRQVFVSAASAASGWTTWTPKVQVSDGVSVFPWIKAGGPGRADAVWYGSDKQVDPSSQMGQAWNVFMSQVVFPVSSTGAITGAAPSKALVKVTPHPMHFNDICLAGSDCITQQGNRNLADFFVITIDRTGAAEIVYDDTSNGLVQKPGDCSFPQVADHCGAGVVTLARQSSGLGLFGTPVSGPSNAPVAGLSDAAGDALFPVIGGTNVRGMDILSNQLHLSSDGKTLQVMTRVVDLRNPAATAASITGAAFLQYVTRWQMGNTIYYAAMENTGANAPTFYAGKAQTIDLCSISACFPHVMVYAEPPYAPASTESGLVESGSVHCPPSPSVTSPCEITINVKVADVGSPTASSLLEEVGGYAFGAQLRDNTRTNEQAEADNVPLEIDGVCCYNFKASVANGPLPACFERDGKGQVKGKDSGKADFEFDLDACKDNDTEFVSESDPGSGTDFHATSIDAQIFDEGSRTLTVFGAGTNAGHSVTFTMVAVDNDTAPGTYSLTLSDGYAVSGTLITGAIHLF